MNKLQELAKRKQAIWLDTISRSMVRDGGLQKRIADGVRGVTSNPSIFKKAIADSHDYDDDIVRLSAMGKTLNGIYEALVLEDICQAADLLHPLYEQTNALDGYVSLEVSPKLANDTEGTIVEARRLFSALGRPNIMIKIPATCAGIPAIEEVSASGISVNVTLIFSLAQYEDAADAYMAGLEKMVGVGGEISRIASVASFFVSRVDTAMDAVLEKTGNTEFLGRIAVDNARLAYAHFQENSRSDRWAKLARAGAQPQRPLWASTGTKNPIYSDTRYVDNLIGSETVNTVPPATLDAFMDHGQTDRSIEEDVGGAQDRIDSLGAEGVDFDEITDALLNEGVDAFAQAFDDLMHSIEEKRNRVLEGAA